MTAIIDPLATAPVSVQRNADIANEKPVSKPNTSSSASKYGPAVVLTLSDPAQAIVDGRVNPTDGVAAAADRPTNPSVNTPQSSQSAAPANDPDNDGDVHTPAVVEKEPEGSIAKSKRKVEAQVGVVGANQVVDRNGNIDKIKLDQLIEQSQSGSAA